MKPYPTHLTGSFQLSEGLSSKDKGHRARTRHLAKSAIHASLRNDPLPNLPNVDRDPRCLKRAEQNVRRVEPGHIREIANAISTLGFSVPILIDEHDVIIDGVARTEAAKLLNLPSIPCVVAQHLSLQERALLRIASNRLVEKGSWDLENLQVVFDQLVIDGAPIEISGFDLVEIDGILSSKDNEAVESGPLAPELSKAATTQLGDVYLLGQHQVICGDALNATCVFELMAGTTTRLVLTDVPYNVPIAGNVTSGAHREFAMASGEMSDEHFQAFNEGWMRHAFGYLVDGGVLATFIDWRGIATVTIAARSLNLEQINLIVWDKTNAAMGSLYRSKHELLPMFKKGTASCTNNVKLGKTGRTRSNVWTYAGASTRGSDARRGLQDHPTVKPVAMLSDALLDLTRRGDVVLDPFLGSGSTLIAAERTGRVCRGIELDPYYVDVIIRRYQEATGKQVILESTGEAFVDLAERRTREAEKLAEQLPQVSSTALSVSQGVQGEGTRDFRKRTRARPVAA